MTIGKLAVISCTLMAVSLIVLPQTVSLFVGQHMWYKLDGGYRISTDVPCEKCHADIVDEMESTVGPHTGETGYGRMDCEFCHRVYWGDYQYATAGESEIVIGEKAHAASTVACMACHGCVKKKEFDAILGGSHTGSPYFSYDQCAKCHGENTGDYSPDVPPAGGFGLTNYSGDTGRLEAHMVFVLNAINSSKMVDSNEACIACHTYVPVKINWTHKVSLEFNCTYEYNTGTSGVTTHYNVTNWTVNGTRYTTVYGNTTGNGSVNDASNWPGW
ncbi:hypothetical protein [Archaeoglobus veneficus]|uniref:Uncharacterized protein n=1 Tax=Archaeoglobus veneficus (strain DSM 11195 / SNP6) TaxID=693661 RepID=F2KMU7_ARCVS|nr:hypothetical protein [Archaeoglobus veneficus]AEA46121.1 hypothetical protein Arcve_0080 [Archaeoglobus veneficus SNP6]